MSDLIDRQAAIDELTENEDMINAALDSLTLDYNTRRNLEQRREQIDEDIETIKEMPSSQPKRKKGRWISRDGEEDCYECSECHAVIEGDEVYWRNNYFCYHCGADMRGGEDA